MRRDETYNGVTGLLISAIEYRENDTIATIVYNSDGSVASEQVTTAPPLIYPPLDTVGALTTLLVVLDIITLEDGANVIHEEPAHLVAEAQAWSIGNG
jgi:hypothetical protein